MNCLKLKLTLTQADPDLFNISNFAVAGTAVIGCSDKRRKRTLDICYTNLKLHVVIRGVTKHV